MVAPTIKTSNIAQTGRGWRLNVCEANFTLSEAKQHDSPPFRTVGDACPYNRER